MIHEHEETAGAAAAATPPRSPDRVVTFHADALQGEEEKKSNDGGNQQGKQPHQQQRHYTGNETLMELAKDHNTAADHFLALARAHPEQLHARESTQHHVHHHHHHHHHHNHGDAARDDKCLVCGNKFEGESKFCRKCGEKRQMSVIVDGHHDDDDDDDDEEAEEEDDLDVDLFDDDNDDEDEDDDDDDAEEDEEEDVAVVVVDEGNHRSRSAGSVVSLIDAIDGTTPAKTRRAPSLDRQRISPTEVLLNLNSNNGGGGGDDDARTSEEGQPPPRAPHLDHHLSSSNVLSSTMSSTMAGLGDLAGKLDPGMRLLSPKLAGWRRGASAAGAEKSEGDLTPMHYFLARCRDLRGDVVLALHLVDSTVLTATTSLRRTPVHHMLAYRRETVPDDVLTAIHRCHEGAFTDADAIDHTPLDRYFRHNKRGVMDVSRDALVDALCRACDAWGLEALVKSKAGYRKPHLMHRELRRFRVLYEGNPFQVETFVKNVMHLPVEDEMVAQLKFMFVVMPLRSPTKYGMTSSQGLNFYTKVLTTVVDVYAQEKDAKLKRLWMNAFADAALCLIVDENLLGGMFLDPPSIPSVEALASTEFLSAILNYKFNAGPILVFSLEIILFLLLFAMLAYQMLTPVPSLLPVCVSCLFTLYFTVREVHQMYTGRREEIKSHQAEREKEHEHEQAAAAAVTAKFEVAKLASDSFGNLSGFLPPHDDDQHPNTPLNTSPPGTDRAAKTPSEEAAKDEQHGREDTNRAFGKSPSAASWCEADVPTLDMQAAEAGGKHDTETCASCVWRQLQKLNEENLSYCLTVYLMMPVAWRSDPFNWVDLFTLVSCWVTQAGLLRHGIDVAASVYDDEEPIRLYVGEFSVRVMCVSFLSVKLFGFLSGTSMKMATFILMLQEISFNVDSFIVVFFLMLLMFTLMYHILLRDENGRTKDWMEFDVSLWQVWTYALGEFDDVGYQTDNAHLLFSFFMLVMVIIMMNILIAIVSDSYDDAMKRSAQIYWRARVLLIAEYEPLLPKLQDNEFMSLMDKKTMEEFMDKQVKPPNTWQYHCLMFQEGLVATALVCGVVFFELLYINQLSDEPTSDGGLSLRFYAGLGVSIFFLLEIMLRGYNWWHTFHSWTRTAIGGFFTNPFRCIDSLLVFIDVVMLIITLILDDSNSGGSSNAKAAVKLARVVRLARSARWLRGIKMLRSCRFFAKLANQWRKSQRPTKEATITSLERSFKSLEESNSWAGRLVDVSSKVKDELQRSTSHVIHSFGDMQQEIQKANAKTAAELSQRIDAVTKQNTELLSEVLELRAAMHKSHLKSVNHVPGFEDHL